MAQESSFQKIKNEELKTCPECGSNDLDKKSGESYCKKCGFVID